VKIICHYKRIGEVDGNLTGLLSAKGVNGSSYDINADSAPVIYVHHQPGRTDPAVRTMEQDSATLKGDDLAAGRSGVKLTNYLADPVELKILHMVTGDPKRTPSFVLFGNTDFWLQSGSASCGTSCFSESATNDAWNHGTVGSQINTTWLGMVGPDVAHLGTDNAIWSDHTNIQPTMMALLRLHDDYTPDGRVLGEIFKPADLPAGMRAHGTELVRLGQAYTKLEAPVGPFGLATLKASTRALESKAPGDATYNRIENELAALGNTRDFVAGQMRRLLVGAAFGGHSINIAVAQRLIQKGDQLLGEAETLAA